MLPLSFLRFRAQPPSPLVPPPRGKIDVYYSPLEGKFIARDFQGNAIKFDAAGSGTTAIPGTTTNDSAAVGDLGEYFTSSGTPSTSLTTNTPVDVGQVDLTAGDWDVEAAITWGAVASEVTQLSAGLSVTPGTTPSEAGDFNLTALPASLDGLYPATLTRKRFSLAAPAPIYLKSNQFFGSGALQIFDFVITARRVR